MGHEEENISLKDDGIVEEKDLDLDEILDEDIIEEDDDYLDEEYESLEDEELDGMPEGYADLDGSEY